MDEEVIEKLSALVKHITETGEWTLDSNDLKVLNKKNVQLLFDTDKTFL